MIFDDYGFPSCPGARAAVDEFFRGAAAVPLVLSTGQAVVFKSMA
jgi:O-methyltransferase